MEESLPLKALTHTFHIVGQTLINNNPHQLKNANICNNSCNNLTCKHKTETIIKVKSKKYQVVLVVVVL